MMNHSYKRFGVLLTNERSEEKQTRRITEVWPGPARGSPRAEKEV